MKKTPAKDIFVKSIATFFGAGLSPWAPGTMGSLAGVVVAWYAGGAFWGCLAAFMLLGFLVSKPAVTAFASGDPSAFVIDEVVGVMIAVTLIPRSLGLYAVGFVLFRAFDILKPWPICIIQRSKRPWAIMADDMLAGIFANALLQGYLFFNSFFR